MPRWESSLAAWPAPGICTTRTLSPLIRTGTASPKRAGATSTKYMRVVTPDATEANAYVQENSRPRWGAARGGWAAAVKHLGGNVPDWVAPPRQHRQLYRRGPITR